MDQKVIKLKEELKKLKKELNEVTLEKGLCAQENKDLRENFAYCAYEQKECFLIARINKIIREIYTLTAKPIKNKNHKIKPDPADYNRPKWR